MKRKTLRMAAVSAVAAMTIGAGAGLAQAEDASVSVAAAAEAARAQAAEERAEAAAAAAAAKASLSAADAGAFLAHTELAAELSAADTESMRAVAEGRATELQARGVVGSAAKALYKLIKKHGGKVFDDAVKAAKRGWSKFRSYMDGLAWYHPVRIAWVAAGGEVQYQLYSYIRSLF
ncbi:hypothetical protein [Streptomyces sp. S.PB5]|uniref:hypothetical protein n=1 Tax=Streptomyces sp. S.PB5 TaxID=3020844 RepID=UPI0025B0A2A2|nr:hypothetical protein [Streptomyces sp. S.PB5]MDN3023256.1 hypothetical protein [Streptomyces sp. S.PB5]